VRDALLSFALSSHWVVLVLRWRALHRRARSIRAKEGLDNDMPLMRLDRELRVGYPEKETTAVSCISSLMYK